MPISTPNKIITPWATSGLKATIPETADPVNGRAGFDQGFPPINMTPKVAGGIPPFGQDFNGIFFDLTDAMRYLQAGGSFPYDSVWAAAVGGYPLGALVQRSDRSGLWLNISANNTTNPDTGGAGWTTPDAGISSVPMASSNVTLTSLQAARSIIEITGTLTANLQLVFPAYQKQWLIVNNATGAFSVTCKTAAGSGVAVPTASTLEIFGNGTNIMASASVVASSGGVVGSRSNLKMTTTGTSALAAVTVDEIAVESSSNQYQTLRNVSVTPSLAASGANGLDTGVSAASTWYSVWVIWNGTTTAGLFSLSATAPTMPAGYTHKARVCWVRTDATANKYPLRIVQAGNQARYAPLAGTNLTAMPIIAQGIQAAATAYATGNFVPTTAVVIHGICSPDSTFRSAVGPSSGFYDIFYITAGAGAPLSNSVFFAMVLESTNIYGFQGGAASRTLAYGWEDNL